MKIFSTLSILNIFIVECFKMQRIFGNKIAMIIMMHDVKMHFIL